MLKKRVLMLPGLAVPFETARRAGINGSKAYLDAAELVIGYPLFIPFFCQPFNEDMRSATTLVLPKDFKAKVQVDVFVFLTNC